MSEPRITLIVAAAENNAIGKNNQMPWHLPNDFKYFKSNTIDHTIVMGRKTFESIGRGLPQRRNLVLTTDLTFNADDIDIATNIQEMLRSCRDEKEIFIIGGAQIYKQTLPLADKVLLTRVHTHLDGDAFFPELPAAQWKLISQEAHPADDRHAYAYTFEVWQRIAAAN